MTDPIHWVVIIGHGAVNEAVERHLPIWVRIRSRNVLFLSPTNDPLRGIYDYEGFRKENIHRSNLFNKYYGLAGHCGKEAAKRLRWLLSFLTENKNSASSDRVMIFEYDSVALVAPKAVAGLCGIVFPNDEPERFIAPRYVNPPWTLDYGSLRAINKVAQTYLGVWEEGYADRYLSALAHLAGVPILPYDPPGFSQINIAHDCPSICSETKIYHGIKSKETLNSILESDTTPLNDESKRVSDTAPALS